MLSLDAVDQFITSGSCQEMKLMKRLHEKLQVLKTSIRMEQERLQKKRKVWRKVGVVGEFRYLRVYDYDREGFIEFLYDLGILPRVSSIDQRLLTDEEKDQLLPIQRIGKPIVRYFPKRTKVKDEPYEVNTELKSLDEQVMEWKVTHLRHEAFARDWDQVKKSAAHSLKLLENKKISFAHGSISLMESPVKYDPMKIQERLGPEGLLSTAFPWCNHRFFPGSIMKFPAEFPVPSVTFDA